MHRLKLAWRYIARYEPTRLRAVWAALVLLAAALGVAVPADVDAKVTGVIAALAVLVPLLQGEATRRAVVPNAKHAQEVETARYLPPPM